MSSSKPVVPLSVSHSTAWKHWYTIKGTAVPSRAYRSFSETPNTGFNGGRFDCKLLSIGGGPPIGSGILGAGSGAGGPETGYGAVPAGGGVKVFSGG